MVALFTLALAVFIARTIRRGHQRDIRRRLAVLDDIRAVARVRVERDDVEGTPADNVDAPTSAVDVAVRMLRE